MSYLKKNVINPDRVRKVPGSFSWVDRRLMREGYLQRLNPEAMILYFFLIIVGDHQGLSFYGQQCICENLGLSLQDFKRGRRQLIIQDLIAYQKPLYQVLSLGTTQREIVSSGENQPMLIKEIIDLSLKQFS